MIMGACLGACSPGQASYSDFKHVSGQGWYHDEPYYFTLQYPDSLQTYDIYIAVRHDNGYEYSSGNFIVDFIHENSSVERVNVNMTLSDRNGNWVGDGFGALYQMKSLLKEHVRAGDIAKMVLWHRMSCDTLTHLTDIGIILEPN